MKVFLPQSDSHPQVKVILAAGDWQSESTFDNTHRAVDLPLPKGVSEDDVEASAVFCNRRGVAATSPVILKPRKEKSANVQSAKPAASAKSGADSKAVANDPKAESASLPKAEPVSAEVGKA